MSSLTLTSAEFLLAPIARVVKANPATLAALEKLAGPLMLDLLLHRPVGVVDRRGQQPLSSLQEGQVTTQVVRIEEYMPAAPRSRQPFRVYCRNPSGQLIVSFFRAYPDSIMKRLPLGEQRVVSGKMEIYQGELHMAHPEYIVPVAALSQVGTLEPVYPLTAGLPLARLIRVMQVALKQCPELSEWLGEATLQRKGWPSFRAALKQLHSPKTQEDLLPHTPFRERLAYDELLANQLSLVVSRESVKRQPGRRIVGTGMFRNQLLSALPFHLTNGQMNVLAEVDADMASPTRMTRLLQGDVGSGKTVVALCAMLSAIEQGLQVAFMAPTEILGQQHAASIQKMLVRAGLDQKVRVAQLTGRDKGKSRDQILRHLRNGHIDLIIGTHALFQEDVRYKNLGFVVIDEQHRFGVKQRLALSEKGRDSDVLLMTATPIPRTLTLTFYGDMDISLLKEKPADRKPIDTRAISLSRMGDLITALKRVMQGGNRVYWICPLVEESETLEVAAAESRYEMLKAFFPKVGMVHGKMKAKEKDAVMSQFQKGEVDLLVATTVVEVGVDVPEATIIVIEHAERFGLAQLHQLRGRVGRNDKASTCMLLYHENLTEIGRKRLEIMRASQDGFYIAEQDLLLRGSGELLGTRQSGFPDFKIADLQEHGDLLLMARDDAKWVMQHDPNLVSQRGSALRTLLRLFGYQEEMADLLNG